MNRERRKVIGNIFADAAKYTLTAGVIGSLISGEIPGFVFVATGCAFTAFTISAYYITPKDKENG